jgi:hypothetical protein
MPRWAIIGNENDEFPERAGNLLRKWGSYRIKRGSGKISFAVSLSTRGKTPCIQRSDWMDVSTFNQFDISHFPQLLSMKEFDKFKIDPQKYTSLHTIIRNKQGAQRLEGYQRIIFFSPFSQLNELFKCIIAPEFFSEYPKGNIIVLGGSSTFHLSIAALRVLGLGIDIADRDFQVLQKIGPLKMLRNIQYTGIFDPGKYLSIPIALFLPRLYGFVAQKISMSFIFLFDNIKKDVREFYPRSVLEYIRGGASRLFGQSNELDLDTRKYEIDDNFALITREFTAQNFRDFINEYISKLNHFVNYMIDPSNFIQSESNEWIALAHYRAWLTFDRISDEIIYMLTDDTSFLRKMALFRILDQFAGLASEDHAKQSNIFKCLLLPKENGDPISSGLSSYQGIIGKFLLERLAEVRQELIKTGLESIYIPNKVDKNHETVTLLDNSIVSTNDYLTNMIRELRNTYHGYYTRGFNNYLSISTGNTPDSLPIIGVLTYLAFLARPDLFINRKW